MITNLLPVVSLRDKIRLMVYETLFNNVKHRLCQYEETIDYDFFTACHFNAGEYLEDYGMLPRTYHCKSSVGFQGRYSAGNTYLVVSGIDCVVLLLEPEAAFARNLPFMAILEGNVFKPYLGCPMTLWQNRIERITSHSSFDAVMC